jgi:peptidyl-prolyl cis-trans isomerase C
MQTVEQAAVNGVAVEGRVGAVWELLRQRAVATGLVAAEAAEDIVNEAIEQLLEREVRTPEPTDEECRRWYDAHPESFTAGELVYARHILFAVIPGTPIEPLRAKAEAVLHELLHHPERFAERAAELSNCPSGAQGGSLGQLTRGECVPEFEREVFREGAEGILTRLVNSRHGFHIVALDGRVPGHRVPFDAVRSQVANALMQSVWKRALAQYVGVLAGQARVEGVALGAADSPLVQ